MSIIRDVPLFLSKINFRKTKNDKANKQIQIYTEQFRKKLVVNE